MVEQNVRVYIRERPLSEQEKREKSEQVTQISESKRQIRLQNKEFAFDRVFSGEATQEQVYEETLYEPVERVLEGYNATMFAYGQTGSGKTHTMVGYFDFDDPSTEGFSTASLQLRRFDIDAPVILRSATDSKQRQWLVAASYLEIYNDEIRDLLQGQQKESRADAAKKKAKIIIRESKEKGVYVEGLTQRTCHSTAEMMKLIRMGSTRRTVASTKMNEASSRSHAIFMVRVESSEIVEMEDGSQRPRVRSGKLNLVDLAGSERQSRTGAKGKRLKEAARINLSLSALGLCISTLAEKKSHKRHVPFRLSKLTRILQDSLGGNTMTTMIGCISPASANAEESISTLRYCQVSKNIKCQPTVNLDPKDAMILKLQSQLDCMKQLLLRANSGESVSNELQKLGFLNASAGEDNLVASEDLDSTGTDTHLSEEVELEIQRRTEILKQQYSDEIKAMHVEMEALKAQVQKQTESEAEGKKAVTSSEDERVKQKLSELERQHEKAMATLLEELTLAKQVSTQHSKAEEEENTLSASAQSEESKQLLSRTINTLASSFLVGEHVEPESSKEARDRLFHSQQLELKRRENEEEQMQLQAKTEAKIEVDRETEYSDSFVEDDEEANYELDAKLRDELLDELQSMKREMEFYKQVSLHSLGVQGDETVLERIRRNARYDDDACVWYLPPDYLADYRLHQLIIKSHSNTHSLLGVGSLAALSSRRSAQPRQHVAPLSSAITSRRNSSEAEIELAIVEPKPKRRSSRLEPLAVDKSRRQSVEEAIRLNETDSEKTNALEEMSQFEQALAKAPSLVSGQVFHATRTTFDEQQQQQAESKEETDPRWQQFEATLARASALPARATFKPLSTQTPGSTSALKCKDENRQQRNQEQFAPLGVDLSALPELR